MIRTEGPSFSPVSVVIQAEILDALVVVGSQTAIGRINRCCGEIEFPAHLKVENVSACK